MHFSEIPYSIFFRYGVLICFSKEHWDLFRHHPHSFLRQHINYFSRQHLNKISQHGALILFIRVMRFIQTLSQFFQNTYWSFRQCLNNFLQHCILMFFQRGFQIYSNIISIFFYQCKKIYTFSALKNSGDCRMHN
jgi:hypothetical protein